MRELTTQSAAKFAIKVQLINVFGLFVTGSLVLVFMQEDIWFVVAFPSVAVVALLAFVALVPGVGRRQT